MVKLNIFQRLDFINWIMQDNMWPAGPGSLKCTEMHQNAARAFHRTGEMNFATQHNCFHALDPGFKERKKCVKLMVI